MDVKKTIEKYDQELAQDAKIAKLERLAREGVNKWRAAEELASRTGLTAAQVLLSGLLEEYPDGKIPEEAARELTVPLIKHNYERVSETAEAVQKATIEEAGIGLKALKPEFNKDRAEGLARNISSWENLANHKDQVMKEVENNSRSIVDDTIRTNAAAHESAGLQTLVTRIYDGVGLSNGRTCEWCLARCGEDMPYSEAYAKGAFQRHPGCGCELIYKVGKRTQRQSDWTRNKWEDVSPYERIAESASQEGGMVTIPPFMEGNFEDCHPLSITDEERDVFKRIHEEVAKRGCEYGEIITSGGNIPCESNKESSVLMRTDNIDEYGLKLYHGHTNDTPPSEKDLFRFVSDEKVDEIGVLTRNGDIFTVTLGDGYIPSEAEFQRVATDAATFARRYVVDNYDLSKLSEKEVEYLFIRTKNIEIIQQLGWRIEGGKI